ncbi:hypothetical protein AA0111_g10092 [Alternaria arborescens]|uniref:hypothetical protein n=1 Tax=Alternaria arborescens TaxID=156630 RepID=UPI001074B624|nr:hypothetical protein AA0111_g10092 [Alternaria arborescens]RYO20382.1 hypothetical protein AA0111_g10092 [Alternaria arborescens]
MHSNISLTIYLRLNTALFSYGITGTIDLRTGTTDYKNVNALCLPDLYLITVIPVRTYSIHRQITITITNTRVTTNMSSSNSSDLPTARRIPTMTFDTILPPDKMTTWEQEDAAAKKKRSSAELAASAKSKAGATMKSALSKADQLKKVVSKAKAKRDTDKQIRKAEKEHQKATR